MSDIEPNREQLKELVKMVTKMDELIRGNLEGKPVFMLSGKSGAGKSTLVNDLMGNKLRIWEDETVGATYVNVVDEQEVLEGRAPKIGISTGSETLYPAGFPVKALAPQLVVDTGGFGDNRGETQDALAYLGQQMLIKRVGSVSALVFVVNLNLTGTRGEGPRDLLNLVQKTLAFNERVVAHLKNTVLFVFNLFDMERKTVSQIKAMFEKVRQDILNQEGRTRFSEEEQASLDMCALLVEHGNIALFNPRAGEHKQAENRAVIINFLRKAPGIPKEDLVFCASNLLHSYTKLICQVAGLFLRTSSSLQGFENQRKQLAEERETLQREVRETEASIRKLRTSGITAESIRDMRGNADAHRAQMQAHQSRIASMEGDIHRAENDIKILRGNEDVVCVYSSPDFYCENAFYGVVKKGIVKTRTLTHKQSYRIERVECSGKTQRMAEGSAGRFEKEEFNEGRTEWSILYVGPSHEYGKASFKVYSKKSDTPDFHQQRNNRDQYFQRLVTSRDNYKRQVKQAEESAREWARQAEVAESQKANVDGIIADHEKGIAQLRKKASVVGEKIATCEGEIVKAKGELAKWDPEFRMVVTLNGLAEFREATVQQFIARYTAQ